jgi:hypothetical protein
MAETEAKALKTKLTPSELEKADALLAKLEKSLP